MAGTSAATASALPAAPKIHLRLLETSDLHMFVYDYDYYSGRQDNNVGLAKVATLVAQARAEASNSLLFDNGDILQGNPLGDYMALPSHLGAAGHPMFRAMNRLGYDAATFGNHEFNYGLGFLRAALRSARFPFVCANVESLTDTPLAPPVVVLERHLTDEAGTRHLLRVGVIGLVTPQIMIWDKAHLQGQLRASDIVEAAERHLPALRSQCDLVVALCHSGISPGARQDGEENAALHLAALDGIDVVFTGHAHLVFPGLCYAGHETDGIDARTGRLAGKPAVMPGFWGSHLGVIDLTLEPAGPSRWRIARFAVEARPIARLEGHQAISLADDDADVLAAAAPEHAATLRWMQQPVGATLAPIHSYFSLVADEASLSLINAAQLWYARPLLAETALRDLPVLSAASPFMAGGTGPDAYVDIAAGPIDMRDIASLYPYANTVCAVRLSGAELRAWLERAARVFNRIDPAHASPQALLAPGVPSYMFDVIAGLTYAVDLSRSSHRIVDLRHQGVAVDDAQPFVLVTNNYRAGGGGGFPATGDAHLVLAAPDLTRDVLIRYVTRHQPLEAATEAVWRFAPLGRKLRVTFDCGPGAALYLPAHPAFSRLGEAAGGYVRYGVDLG